LSSALDNDEPRWTPQQAAVHAALTLQFALDMFNLLDSTWAIPMNVDRAVLHPLAAFGTHPEPNACARHTRNLLVGKIAPATESTPCTTCSLLVHGRTVGVIALGPKRQSSGYSAADLNLLAEAAAHIGTLLENDRMSWHHATNIVEAQRARRELETAREMQNRFFPTRFSAVCGLDYYGECEPRGEVGGDFFDSTPLPDNGLAMAVGDVSGHSVPAAIIIAALQSALRSVSSRDFTRPANLVAELNRMVCDLCPDNLYATLFYALVDPEKGKLTYVNAGHEPALLLRSDTRRRYRLRVGGTVLGLTRRSAYEEAVIPLQGGDTLVANTDGVTDTADAEHIAACLRARPDIGARDLVREILHARGASTSLADRTAIAVRLDAIEEEAPLFAVASEELERAAEVVAA